MSLQQFNLHQNIRAEKKLSSLACRDDKLTLVAAASPSIAGTPTENIYFVMTHLLRLTCKWKPESRLKQRKSNLARQEDKPTYHVACFSG